MQAVQADLGSIAEMALGARDLREFEAGWLDFLKPRVGFEAACSVWSESSGAVRDVTSSGYDEGELARRFPNYMSELSAQELARFSAVTPAIDLDVVSSARRQRLTVYRELLSPHGIKSFVTNVWRVPWGVFGFHLARTGARSFSERETTRLQLLAPCIKLGQGLFAQQRISSTSLEAEWWACAWSLSSREREVARLVVRGFSNPEIAILLRVSMHTVRNHLANVFYKADVSNRTELVFMMVAAPDEARRARKRSGFSPWNAFLAQGPFSHPGREQ